jgi:IS5 family transposase
VFRTIGDQVPLWESLLPEEVLRLPVELARVDALLDDPVFFAPFAGYFDPQIGRPSTPMECYLRLMFLKFRYRLGYESLCAEVADSISWRRFCRIPIDGKVPHPTTLMKLTTRCGEGAVAGLNEALWVKAAQDKLLRTGRVRADTTVIAADVAYPADSGLLAKAVGKLVRTARRVQAAGGATGTTVTGRRRMAARRVRQIAARLRTRGKLSREESTQAIRRVTSELADLAENAAAEAAAVLRNGRRAVPKALSGRVRGRLRRALDELATAAERTRKIAQTRTRLAGQVPEGATRLVSLHDPDARPIRKGRIDKPVEFGYKAQVAGNDDGIILDYSVEYGAAPGRPAAGAGGGADHPPGPPHTPRGHRRPRLRLSRRRARPARPGRALHRDPPPSQDLTSPESGRAPAQLPAAGQVAHRLGRPDQLPQTRLRLGPHPAGQQARGHDLVRARGIRPQLGQDRGNGQLTGPAGQPRTDAHARPASAPGVFQVEVAKGVVNAACRRVGGRSVAFLPPGIGVWGWACSRAGPQALPHASGRVVLAFGVVGTRQLGAWFTASCAARLQRRPRRSRRESAN